MDEKTTWPVNYGSAELPQSYRCGECGAHGVRLYRRYQTFLEGQALFCRSCALADQKKPETDGPSEHSIGWLVAAVPTEEGDTFWGYTSVPGPGVEWWDRLPASNQVPVNPEPMKPEDQ